jgi:tetratricopeptide (TPR) repeat protein
MNPHLQRALMLLEQARHELAAQELRQALVDTPNDAMTHAVLAMCLSANKQYDEASEEAETAIHLQPDQPFGFYAHSVVLRARNRFAEAQTAIEQAIGMDPDHPSYFSQLGQLHFDQRRWQAALEAAESGLALDPEDVECINVRAMALVRLGRKMDASAALETALQHDPEDEFAHANLGWALIEQGKHEEAMEHFREALRLNPQLDWARQGIVEAMKARYFIYRIMLGYFLWMMKLTSKMQWYFLIGAFLGFQFLVRQLNDHPWLMPLVIAYVGFALMTWIATPLFNLVLRLNRFGRLALSREQIVTSNWVGLCVLGAFTFLGIFFFRLVPNNIGPLYGAMACVFMIPPLSNVYNCEPGKPRNLIICVSVLMGLVGFFASVPLLILSRLPDPNAVPAILLLPTVISLKIFTIVALGSQLAANFLVMARPHR